MAKYQKRKTTHKPDNPSFQWEVLNYDLKTKTYKIKNKATGEMRSLSREDYIYLVNRQGNK